MSENYEVSVFLQTNFLYDISIEFLANTVPKIVLKYVELLYVS